MSYGVLWGFLLRRLIKFEYLDCDAGRVLDMGTFPIDSFCKLDHNPDICFDWKLCFSIKHLISLKDELLLDLIQAL